MGNAGFMPEKQEPRKRPDIRDEHLKAIGGVFFEDFCREFSVPDHMRPSVDPKPFMQWLPTEVAKYTYETLQAAVEPVKITPDSAKFMLELPFKAYGPNHITALWPFLTLKNRTRKHAVRSVNLALMIQFEDGTIVPMNMLAHKDISTEPLDDGHVAHLVITRTPDLATQVSLTGLDVLHDKHVGKMAGLADYEAMTFFGGIAATLIHNGELPKLEPADVEKAKQYAKNLIKTLGFVQQLFPGEIPDSVKQSMAGQGLKKQTPGGFNEA